MAVGSSFTPGGNNVGGFPQTGGNIQNRETPQERRDRITSEDRAQEVLNDPYGLRQQPGQTPGTTKTVLKRVRVRRNNGQAEGANNSNGTNGTEGASRRGGAQRGGPAGQAGTHHMLQRSTLGQSSLVRASVLFQNNQPQQAQQNPGSNLAVRNKMLQGLNNYIQNDYQMMKLNPDDKAFTYRTAEARQLGATIGQMVASTTRQSSKSDKTNEEQPTPRLSPEAFGRQKGLLRRLAAMSEPNPKMPDNLPTDYRPFESVA